MIAARQIFLGRRGAKLPYDAEVEFLESTGTQWIDTGVIPFSDDYTSFEYRASTASDLRSVIVGNFFVSMKQGVLSSEFGGNANGRPFCPRGYVENKTTYATLWNAAVLSNVPVDVVVSFTASTSVLSMSVNGGKPQTAWLSSAMVSAAYTLALFKDYRASTTGFSNSVRIYHMDISSGAGYVRCFVPVRFTNEHGVSEGAMYDRLNPTVGMNRDGTPRNDGLYLNRGTGVFLYGNDK